MFDCFNSWFFPPFFKLPLCPEYLILNTKGVFWLSWVVDHVNKNHYLFYLNTSSKQKLSTVWRFLATMFYMHLILHVFRKNKCKNILEILGKSKIFKDNCTRQHFYKWLFERSDASFASSEHIQRTSSVWTKLPKEQL